MKSKFTHEIEIYTFLIDNIEIEIEFKNYSSRQHVKFPHLGQDQTSTSLPILHALTPPFLKINRPRFSFISNRNQKQKQVNIDFFLVNVYYCDCFVSPNMCYPFRFSLSLRVTETLCSKKIVGLLAFGVIVCLIILSFKLPGFGILYDLSNDHNSPSEISSTILNNTTSSTDFNSTTESIWNPV